MKRITDEDFIRFCGKQESQFIANPSEFQDRTKKIFDNPDAVSGDLLPWSKTHHLVGLRMGEVSIWAGISGHKKSMVSGMVAAWLLPHTTVLVASMEMHPEETLHRMITQCSGTSNPTKHYLDKWFAWTDNRLWIYDQVDTVQPERILGMIHYAASELNVKHIFIDSLMKCGIVGGADKVLAGQKEFVDRLCWAAKSHDCHIHLVHHMRKGDNEDKVPGKFDVRGASEIVDNAHNLFIVHSNKSKAKDREMGKEINENEPDQIIDVAKQRNGKWEGRINLYFHEPSLQFLPNTNNRVMFWNEI